MASTGSGRDSSSSTPPDDKSENPFIRFKRFTDAKVSSVLQGILGLPSAFSSNASEPRTRWAELDDELKRRDELKARQQALKDSESKKISQEIEEANRSLEELGTIGFIAEEKASRAMDDEGELYDVPLYSPITKSLFAHINRSSEDDQVEWKNPMSMMTTLTWALSGNQEFSPWPKNIYKIQENQTSLSPLNMIQAMTFNNLSYSAKKTGCQWLHSDQSVLPYIMFSPYSPLALSMQPTSVPAPRPLHTSYSKSPSQMGWCDAFEDLLLITSGREMGTRSWLSEGPAAPTKDLSSWSGGSGTTSQHEQVAIRGMTWISDLQLEGLLERNVFLKRPSFSEIGFLMSLLSPFVEISGGISDKESHAHGEKDLPQTEEELYTYFQELAAQAKSNAKESPLFADIMSLVGFFENMTQESNTIEKTLDQFAAWRDQRRGPGASSDRMTETPKHFSMEAFLKGHPPTQKSTGTQTEARSNSAETQSSEYHFEQMLLDQQQKRERNLARQQEDNMGEMQQEQNQSTDGPLKQSDRVVSTVTTTEQTTSGDGKKTTNVSVTKYFADGRSVTTETYHSETPNRDDMRKSWASDVEKDEQQRVAKSEKKANERGVNGQGKGTGNGKGWFWN